MNVNSQSRETLIKEGIKLINRGMYHEAIRCFDKAIELNPRDEGAWIKKGHSFSKIGKIKEAGRAYREATKLVVERLIR
jgi:Flp pilus assembly protein TadD